MFPALAQCAVRQHGVIAAAALPGALPACVAVGGAGIGLSSVAATGLGTSVPVADRGSASGIINTAAQLGTALGVAILLLVAALTSGIPAPGHPVPAVAWALAATLSLAGAAFFARPGNRPEVASGRLYDRRAATLRRSPRPEQMWPM